MSKKKPADTTEPCPHQVSVELHTKRVACPGLPHQLTAVGKPAGGTYSWTNVRMDIVGEPALTDAAGKPASSGDTVFLRAMEPGENQITVQYTVNGQSASDTKTVTIHHVGWDVVSMRAEPGSLAAVEGSKGMKIMEDYPNPTPVFKATAKVRIRIDKSCPNPPTCAKNYRLGWLQTMLTNEREFGYDRALGVDEMRPPCPIRDANDDNCPPFYHSPAVKTFNRNGEILPVAHKDSPSTEAAPWSNQYGNLCQLKLKNSFALWLAVQNVEMAKTDVSRSLYYLKNLDWSCELSCRVNVAAKVGNRASPRMSQTEPPKVGEGQGSRTPNLAAPIYNTSHAVRIVPK